MLEEKLKYFKLVKELNDIFHDLLIENKMHFRANIFSFSLISVSNEKPELGIACKESKYKSEDLRKISIMEDIDKIKRIPIPPATLSKPEKKIQAWIIFDAMRNNGNLRLKDNLLFITSELVFANKEEYKLSKLKRDIRNDVLAIDNENNLCIIELKYSRVNEVKRQTIEFEKVIKNETEFFHQLVRLYTNKTWNGNMRKIAVWPKAVGKPRNQEYSDVEEVNYTQKDNDYLFNEKQMDN